MVTVSLHVSCGLHQIDCTVVAFLLASKVGTLVALRFFAAFPMACCSEEAEAEYETIHPEMHSFMQDAKMEEILSQLNALAARVELLERRAETEPVLMLARMRQMEQGQMEQAEEPISPISVRASLDDMDDRSVSTDGGTLASDTKRSVTRAGDMNSRPGTLGTGPADLVKGRSSQLLQESFWDAIVVLGLGDLGMTTTFLVTLGILVSICSQSFFCWIVFVAFLSPDAKYDPEFLKDWRLLVGHAVKGYDANSGSSLISRACRGKPFDREWWADALLTEIDDYLTPLLSEAMSVGVVLSTMAVAIWLAFIVKELQSVAGLMSNVLRIPKGQSLIVEGASSRSSFMRSASATSLETFGSVGARQMIRTFKSISLPRSFVLLLVLTIRATLAVLLGFCGALWLCRTRDIENPGFASVDVLCLPF